jgi:hypothetical protein
MNFINHRILIIAKFCLIFSFITASASTYDYVKKVDPQLESQLISMGDKLLKALYQNQDLKQFTAFTLFAQTQTKKNFFSKLKNADVTILGKKSVGTEEDKGDRRETLAKIIAMMWKIYDVARKRGEDGTSTSYKLIDPQGKLFNYLKNYVALASQQSNVFAYDRDPKKNKSSHYKNVSPEGQWGIDVRFYANQSSLDIFPQDKSHCLFGKLSIDPNQPNILFIKFEHHGIAAPSEVVAHGINYLKSQMRTAAQKSNTRIEKTVRPEIIQKYLNLVAQMTPQDQAKFKTDDAETVREMLVTANAVAQALPQFKRAQEELMQTAKSIYPTDGDLIWDRTGNEIIIDMRSL